ncbi:unnamed protein product [Dovyalis caffra]|uniref:Secreted protein n=1 Tax=Dovyalis caffra TaxID=77055 RepID=A0AAV1S447_9ROSI|nr:unnamed protein product [Dovyalis caffra]
MCLQLRTLASAIMSGQAGVARAGILVAGSAWRNTVATCTARTACPFTQTTSTRWRTRREITSIEGTKDFEMAITKRIEID